MAKFDPYRKWLGIPPKEQPPNHYRLLGIGLFESDPDVISNAADRQMVHVRTFQSGKYSELSQRILNELAAARVCLLDAQRKSEYDRQLRASLAAEMPIPPPRTPTPPPRTPAPPPPPDGESGPTATPPPPQVAAGGSAFPSSTRPSSYAARRKKSNWQGPAITIALLLVSVVLVVWASSTSKSEHGNKQDGTKVKRNENGSSSGRSVKRPRKPRDAGGSGNGRRSPAEPRPPRSDNGSIRAIGVFKGHTDRVTGAVLLPDGAFVLSGSEDQTVRMWDVESGTGRSLDGPTAPILSVAVSADGRTVLAVSGQTTPPAGGVVHLWEAGSGRQTLRIDVSKSEVAWDAAFSPDGKHVLLACEDATMRLLEVVTKKEKEIRQFTGHEGPVRSAVFSADGSKILSGSADQTVRLWDPTQGRETRCMLGHEGAVTSVAFSPDGNYALSGGVDGTVRIWDVETGRQRHKCQNHLDVVTCVACSPDGRYALSGSLDGTMRLWRLSDGVAVQRFGSHKGGVRSVAFSADGRRVVSAGDDALVRLWELPDPLEMLVQTPGTKDGPQDETPNDQAPELKRLPVPDDASRQKAEELIKNEVFKTDFQQADRPSRKSALAQKLLNEGVKPQDNPASAYVLLQLARNLATELADAGTALAAVDQIAKRYQIHALSEKVKTLDTVAQQTKASTQKRALVETILEVADEARAADDFNTAGQLVILARATVAGARDGALSKRVAAKAEQIQELKQTYDGVRQALAVLEQQPDDPQANETVGKYYCLAKGDWEQGLSRLAAAADEELKMLAQTDLANPQPTPQRHELAEGWWDAAQKHSGRAKKQLQRRAAKWYKLVEPQLVGIERTAVQQRLLEAGDPDALIAPHTLPQLKGLECRKDTIRPTLLRAFGGNAASEEAVDRALEWLSRHQNADGSWNFDHTGPRCQDRCPNPGNLKTAPNAATALALLPFLGAGHGPRSGKYKKNVTFGLNYLRSRTVWLGPVATLYESDAADMPSHALGTIALSEACMVGRNRQTRAVAQAAVKFITISQNADGGWGTKPQLPDQQPGPSDVYSTGWNLAALKTAQWSGLNVPKKTLQQAQKYLQSMRTKDKTGYRRDEKAGKRDAAATAVAMLCRMYLDMPRDQQELVDYVAALGKSGPATKGEHYLNYYNCQVMREYGGPAWDSWNAVLRDHLIFTQAGKDHAAGSWYIQDKGWGSKSGGRLFCTALAALMLEVYYRHPPLYQ